MVGAEVYIVKNGTCVLGKVRADGNQVADFLTAEKVENYTDSGTALWKEIKAARYARWGVHAESGFKTYFPEGFEFLVGATPLSSAALEDTGAKELSKVLANLGYSEDNEHLFCGYNDLCFVINLDAVGSGRLVEGWEERMAEHDLSDEPACLHFDFWLNDIEAERLFQCINHDITRNQESILKRTTQLGKNLTEETAEYDPYIMAYRGGISALERLKKLLKNKREDKPKKLLEEQ